MVRECLELIDKKLDHISENENEAHPFAKAFGLGALEGLIDAAAVVGVLGLTGCVLGLFKKQPKE